MPNIKSAKKSLKQDQRRRRENIIKKKRIGDLFKRIQKLVKQDKSDEAKQLLPAYDKAIDKAAKTNVLKDRTAARRKSVIRHLFSK
jgi:small subunit ribosomal protein S20